MPRPGKRLRMRLSHELLLLVKFHFGIEVVHLFGAPAVGQLPAFEPSVTRSDKYDVLVAVVVDFFDFISEITRNFEHLLRFAVDVANPEITFVRSFEIGAIEAGLSRSVEPADLADLIAVVFEATQALDVSSGLQLLWRL